MCWRREKSCLNVDSDSILLKPIALPAGKAKAHRSSGTDADQISGLRNSSRALSCHGLGASPDRVMRVNQRSTGKESAVDAQNLSSETQPS